MMVANHQLAVLAAVESSVEHSDVVKRDAAVLVVAAAATEEKIHSISYLLWYSILNDMLMSHER